MEFNVILLQDIADRICFSGRTTHNLDDGMAVDGMRDCSMDDVMGDTLIDDGMRDNSADDGMGNCSADDGMRDSPVDHILFLYTFFSQVRDIPERINQISTTGLR